MRNRIIFAVIAVVVLGMAIFLVVWINSQKSNPNQSKQVDSHSASMNEQAEEVAFDIPGASFFQSGVHYSKNNVNVFYEVTAGRACDNCQQYDKKQRIVGADPETFQVLNEDYTKDKNNFYICASDGPDLFRISTKCQVIENIDRESFTPIANDSVSWYAKDKNHVYFYGAAIQNADSQSFRIIDYNYAVDKNRIYYLDNYNRLFIAKEVKSEAEISNFFSSDHKALEEKLRNSRDPMMESFIAL